MEFDTQVKLTIYRWFARTGNRPSIEEVAEAVGSTRTDIRESYRRLRSERLLLLENDGESIHMAPPFSGVPTQHVVEVGGVQAYANCAWDALGVIAAVGAPGLVRSRCEQSGEALRLKVGSLGPEPSGWLFHSLVPVVRWWDDVVFT